MDTNRGKERQMYRFSRSIYRELAPASSRTSAIRPSVATSRPCSTPARTRSGASPTTAATSPGRRARCSTRCGCTSRFSDQLRVWTVIERNITLALEFLERCPRAPASTASRGSAARTPARARRASASRCPAATTARRTSTSRRRFDGAGDPARGLERLRSSGRPRSLTTAVGSGRREAAESRR